MNDDNRDPLDPAATGACAREDLRIALGALALDALDADEAREVRRHLADCPECQAEYSSFLGVRTLMDAGMVGGLVRSTHRPPVTDVAQARLDPPAPLSDSAPRRTPRPRRRLALAMAGAAASFVLVAAGFFALGRQGGSSGQIATSTPAATRVVTARTAQGVTASIAFGDVAWGTAISTTMANVPATYRCTLSVVSKSGDHQTVGSWGSTSSGDFTVTSAVDLKAADIDHFELALSPYSGVLEIPVPNA